MAREDALVIFQVFRDDSISVIRFTFPGIEHTLVTEELAVQLQTYVDIKDNSYRDLAALFNVHSIEYLIIKEEKLQGISLL